MICDAFFNQIRPQLHFISTALHLLLSQPVGHGFEPRLVIEIFVFPSQWVVGSILSFAILFCNKSVAESSPGVLLLLLILHNHSFRLFYALHFPSICF